jgi:ABC-type sugar transport system substrate-binding protein
MVPSWPPRSPTSNKALLARLAEGERLRNDRVFLILAAFKDEFQIELNYYLLKIATARGLIVQVYCPSEDFSLDAQRASQAQIIQNAGQYSGGLLVASQFADDAIPELEKFARTVSLPLVLIDHVPPGENSEDAKFEFPDNVKWVTVSDTEGAHEAVSAVGEISVEPQRILVIAGPKKKDRQLTFKAGVEARWPKCVVTIDTDGNFNRQETEKIVRWRLTRSLEHKAPYDIIFCTTDTMTLGCLDAIQSMQWAGGVLAPRVIGYDGIKATKDLIVRGRTPLRRVVVQDPERMAGEAITRLLALKDSTNKRNELDEKSVSWIQPTLFPSSDSDVRSPEKEVDDPLAVSG